MASDPVKNPKTVAISMPSANTEYSFTLPVNTKRLLFNLRAPNYLYYSWQTGQVATQTGNFQTLFPGAARDMEGIQIDNANFTVLYFASGAAGQFLECEYWN